MSLIVKANEKEFTPAPEGLWPAVCVDVVDLGIVEGKFGPKPMLKIVWQLEERDETKRRFRVTARCGQSLHTKSRLRPMLESWRGRRFNKEELEGFDLEKLVGICCQVQVVHDLRDEGGVWANAQAVVPYPKGLPKIVAEDYVREKDREKEPASAPAGAATDDDSIPF